MDGLHYCTRVTCTGRDEMVEMLHWLVVVGWYTDPSVDKNNHAPLWLSYYMLGFVR